MKQRGVTIEEIEVGDGPAVKRGDNIRISYELSLRRGDLVESVRDFVFKVGERRVIPGLELRGVTPVAVRVASARVLAATVVPLGSWQPEPAARVNA